MTIEKRILRQNGSKRIFWVALDDSGNIQKISKLPLDKKGRVCYNKTTKLRKGIDNNGN